MPDMMKLLGSTENQITKDKDKANVPHSEINDYQHDSRVLFTFVPNKSFGHLLYISPQSFLFLKTFHSEFSYIFTYKILNH